MELLVSLIPGVILYVLTILIARFYALQKKRISLKKEMKELRRDVWVHARIPGKSTRIPYPHVVVINNSNEAIRVQSIHIEVTEEDGGITVYGEPYSLISPRRQDILPDGTVVTDASCRNVPCWLQTGDTRTFYVHNNLSCDRVTVSINRPHTLDIVAEMKWHPNDSG